jgi:hypothetical protein
MRKKQFAAILLAVGLLGVAPGPTRNSSVIAESQRPEERIAIQPNLPVGKQAARTTSLAIQSQIEHQSHYSGSAKDNPEDKESGRDWPAWIEAAGVIVTAIFTGILAAATIRLWNSTKGLHDETKRLASLAEAQESDMKASIAAAQKSAEAALISANSYRGSERAWLGVMKLDFNVAANMIHDGGVLKNGFLISASCVNSGRTPAIDAELLVNHAIVEKNAPIPFFDVSSVDNQSIASVVPGTVFGTTQRFISDEDIATLNREETSMYLFTRIDYFDVFDRDTRRVTETTFEITVNGWRRDEGIRNPNFIVMSAGKQNSST